LNLVVKHFATRFRLLFDYSHEGCQGAEHLVLSRRFDCAVKLVLLDLGLRRKLEKTRVSCDLLKLRGVEREMDWLFCHRVIDTRELHLEAAELLLRHDITLGDQLVPEHLVEFLFLGKRLVPDKFAILQARLRGASKCLHDLGIELIAIVIDHAAAAASLLSHLPAHELITASPYAKCMDSYLVFASLRRLDHLVAVIHAAISEHKDTGLLESSRFSVDGRIQRGNNVCAAHV